MATENRYGFNFSRLLVLWSMPMFFLALFLFLFFSKYEKISDIKPVDIICFIYLILFSTGVFVFLFFNHLPLARQTKLIIVGKQLTIEREGKEECIYFGEITSIKEYSTAKLPWSSIKKWNISANGKEYIISSLTISQLNFERHFHDRTETKISLFPIL